MSDSNNLIFGLDDQLIDFDTLSCPVHRELAGPFTRLRDRALANGFDLAIASGFRSFERQLLIWNEKVAGKRPVFDAAGEAIDVQELDEWDLVQAILRWSALPGASRHHWGTDIDVYDKTAVPSDYKLSLTNDEVIPPGPFAPLHEWLDKTMAVDNSESFFRPYAEETGGIAPERWHLSYAPLSSQYQQQHDAVALKEVLAAQPILLKDVVLQHLEEIHCRFVAINKNCYPIKYKW